MKMNSRSNEKSDNNNNIQFKLVDKIEVPEL